MHRLESRFQYMKAAGLFFHLVKARLETENAIAAFHCLPNHIFFGSKPFCSKSGIFEFLSLI